MVKNIYLSVMETIRLTIFLCFLMLMKVQGQEFCPGNLGENIFTDGDFGVGTANILLPNPNIAPGYTYTSNVPPIDGQYTITNTTSTWGGLWESWLRIGDSSDDPQGYMMVVNASNAPGDFFRQTITDLCENTQYEFTADIINFIKNGVPNHIKPNVSFLLDDVIQITTGDIAQNNLWNTYGFTFDTEPGQTSLTLTLRNNAPGGIGNDLGLDNISFRACGPSAFIDTDQFIFLCADANDPAQITADLDFNTHLLQWQVSEDEGVTWNDIPNETDPAFFHNNFLPGIYQYRYLSATSLNNLNNFKCRIISDVITIEVLPTFHESVDTICEMTIYPSGLDTLTESGTYVFNLISSLGCDSIVTLDLTVLENNLDFNINTTDPGCLGEVSGVLEIVDITNQNPPVSFWLNEELISGPTATGLSEGDFTIEIIDRFQCAASKTVSLGVPDPFTIDVGPDLSLDFGETSDPVRVNSTGAVSNYTWTPATFLSCADCPQTEIIGAANTNYIVVAEDDNGCIAIDSLQVTLKSDEINIYIPNVFTPNGDGINDYFNLFSYEQAVTQIESLTIYNRWGGVVYSGKELLPNTFATGWDGRHGKELVQGGVYLYVFNIRLIDGRLLERGGSVTVMH